MKKQITKTPALTPDPSNPNRLDPADKKRMARSLDEFGDLSGVILNRRTGLLVGGHQRVDVLAGAEVQAEDLPAPEPDGTVARGWLVKSGKRYALRVVDWDETKAHAALLAANRFGRIGKDDDASLRALLDGLEAEGFDLELAGYTAEALAVLRSAGCSVAILTKGGRRCLDDLPLFSEWPGGRIKVGATLTFNSSALSRKWEPGAADPGDRVGALAELHQAGVKTWASIEPVIVASESLAIIEASLPHVDGYKVGKLNHQTNNTDWAAFGKAAVDMIRASGKALYVKHDLRPYLPAGHLSESECSMESLTLPDRPA